jgi:hypothetical protein
VMMYALRPVGLSTKTVFDKFPSTSLSVRDPLTGQDAP